MEDLNKFKTTDTLGSFISGVGWVIIFISLIVAFVAGGEAGGDQGTVLGIIIFVLGAAIGLLIVSLGQMLQIMVAIERNTAGSSAAAYSQEEESTTTCSGCEKVYKGDLSGQFCEECGVKM